MTDAPAELQQVASTLLDLTGRHCDHTDILIAFLNRLEKLLAELSLSPSEITAQADKFCLQHDKLLTLQTGGKNFTGLCKGIAKDGALLLETPDGLCPFYSGSVVR